MAIRFACVGLFHVDLLESMALCFLEDILARHMVGRREYKKVRVSN
jgi:hypothetical protein